MKSLKKQIKQHVPSPNVPEGTRSKGDGMLPLQGGAALLALRSKCDVVPVYIDGDYRLFRRVTVRVGKPVEMADLIAGRISKDTCEVLNDRIKGAYGVVATLLPSGLPHSLCAGVGRLQLHQRLGGKGR